jgi:hypothetical protein
LVRPASAHSQHDHHSGAVGGLEAASIRRKFPTIRDEDTYLSSAAMTDDLFFDKFIGLHQGEESLRAQSLALIAADADMRMHASIIEQGQDLLNVLIHSGKHKDDDDLAIRMLGIRLFNASAASLKLLLSGYSQNAAFQFRDILETAFLLDFLHGEPALVKEWRLSDKKLRTTKFGPSSVRRALDKRDGHTGNKRDAAYSLLCELAAHPTYMGFQMLLPDGVNAHCGPFVALKTLKASLAELAKLAMQAVLNFTVFFEWDTSPAAEAKIAFNEAQGVWLHHFFGAAINTAVVARLRENLAVMRQTEPQKE